MKLVLVGADFEENLGVGMIAASARQAGHEVVVVPFDEPESAPAVAARVVAHGPDVVGLSIQFQHRAAEFLGLAQRIRRAGFEGHLTSGGQPPSLAWRDFLARGDALDSIVLHDGERTIVELLATLEAGRRPAEVAGLALRADDGAPVRTPGRAFADLDTLPPPARYRPHSRHLGVPFIPILGSRGCWGACTYCSITSFYRDGRASGGGATVRLRSPDHLAGEMAALARGAGGRAIFCFHDDNFLLPRPAASLARVRAIHDALARRGDFDVGIIGKARPDCLDADLARALAALGVLRLYVGVENVSAGGADHLGRARQAPHVGRALDACREAGIFVCYNLLLFEPDATLADLRENVAFLRAHATHPVNFCRAEPYSGTPLEQGLRARGNLDGSILGFGYRIADDPTELAFRVCSAAFRERNFAPEGVANRSMSLGYLGKILERFHPERRGQRARLVRRAGELTMDIVLETAGFLDEAIALVEEHGRDAERLTRETARLGLRIAAADVVRLAQMDELGADMTAYVRDAERLARPRGAAQRLREAARGVAVGASLAVGLGACDCGENVVDPVPADAGHDAMVVDPPPRDAGEDSMVVDPPPPDAGVDATVADPPPPDAGVDATVQDPPPADALPDGGMSDARDVLAPPPVDRWRETGPAAPLRSADLPMHRPPVVSLDASREADGLRVALRAGPDEMTIRWEGDGTIEGDGREVRWTPASPTDRLRVAVRTKGGIAVVSLGVRDAS